MSIYWNETASLLREEQVHKRESEEILLYEERPWRMFWSKMSLTVHIIQLNYKNLEIFAQIMHTIIYRAVLETYSPVNWFNLNVCRIDIRALYKVLGYSTCILNLCAQWQEEDVRNSVKEVDTGFSCPIMECLSTGLLLWRTKVCTAGSWHCISLTVEWLTYWGSLAFFANLCACVLCACYYKTRIIRGNEDALKSYLFFFLVTGKQKWNCLYQRLNLHYLNIKG